MARSKGRPDQRLPLSGSGLQAYWHLRREVFRPGFRDFLDNYVPPKFDRIVAMVRRDDGQGEAAN